ncbi:deoxyribodipyrimidine photo-lyase type I [Murinocardiopsis flavida]|uniref:Deoxyribodipyrimidine photo-lyase type I n=1 Tax=Murinocardiopsis flavida TaxID=645275 RepID=A0A2P8CWS8_9ACTN|nr:deoxyribodipyrimidine photo-lyase [Murinocardiopsis flavida]PSK89399.1 deoxyribodipyrimidine photo-lyase type I [Murinocardiopsis flavida]
MSTVILLYTRDLRVHDHPALHEAVRRGDRVVPLFVLDPEILSRSARNRIHYLRDALADLRAALRTRGGDLVLRTGDTVTETLRTAERTGAGAVFLTRDVSAAAQRRHRRLVDEGGRARVDVREFPGVCVVPPLDLTPAGGDHYKVFTPFWRAWERREWRAAVPTPRRVPGPGDIPVGRLPGASLLGQGRGELSPDVQHGGETAARKRMKAWLAGPIGDYEERHDALAAAATSRLGADLRFGCVSPLELARAARDHPKGAAFVRQLAWRDFHHQVTAAFPEIARRDYRPRSTRWRTDRDGFDAWREGRTGVPIIDAGMRQLRHEGFMHNRARMLTAAFLTRELRVHWVHGGDHFHALLADGDIANNYGNWQWIAGTGNDTRPNRSFNLLRQARRFDPDGAYVRRYVPELAALSGAEIHAPWRLDRPPGGYPPPITAAEGPSGG